MQNGFSFAKSDEEQNKNGEILGVYGGMEMCSVRTIGGASCCKEISARDRVSGRSVCLHVYPADERERLMREADVCAELDFLCDSRELLASVPELIDANIGGDASLPVCYLVYSEESGGVTLDDYLMEKDFSPMVAYDALACAVNTLTVAHSMGIEHGFFGGDCIEMVGLDSCGAKRTLLHGFGISPSASAADSIIAARRLLRKIDRAAWSSGKRRKGRARALLAIERLTFK
jgi:hypothetical protein